MLLEAVGVADLKWDGYGFVLAIMASEWEARLLGSQQVPLCQEGSRTVGSGVYMYIFEMTSKFNKPGIIVCRVE